MGKQIFNDWIERFGKEDKEDVIKVSIILGINKNSPFSYRIHISKNINKDESKEGSLYTLNTRIHEMNPVNSNNLDRLISNCNRAKKYIFFPAKSNIENNAVEPYVENGILKHKLFIKHAWEIGINDLDRIAIRKEDNPIIPSNIVDAPILEVLKRIKEEELL